MFPFVITAFLPIYTYKVYKQLYSEEILGIDCNGNKLDEGPADEDDFNKQRKLIFILIKLVYLDYSIFLSRMVIFATFYKMKMAEKFAESIKLKS